MRPIHSLRSVMFADLKRGAALRFGAEDDIAIGIKAFFNGGAESTLILSGPHVGKFMSSEDMRSQSIVELENVSLLPSDTEGVSPGAGNTAGPNEIELRGADLVFVARNNTRVNLDTGEIKQSDDSRPGEIYSNWSLVRVDGERRIQLYEHKAQGAAPGIAIISPTETRRR
jgi:hypothetical protein